ncbi:hypothetical protein B1H19_13910 [Streptomyces gilvosporeus]|uniref:Uncharacterized protein n=1 Tax=Streptomyces gilvosporeus TaxID=553510 RepID=A0A1V0TQT7_9ACTN|nr:hypothetical protein B1H19_13910 [Streptomyces gilvosporeus]
MFGALAIMLMVLATSLAAVFHSNDVIIVMLVLLVGVCVVSLLIAKDYEFKAIGLGPKGLSATVEKVKGEVGDLQIAIFGLLTKPEREKLKALVDEGPVMMDRVNLGPMKLELDRLVNMGYIESKNPARWPGEVLQDKEGWTQEGQFSLKDYVKIAPPGAEYLKAYERYRKSRS